MDWMVEEPFPKENPKRMVNGCWVAKPADGHLHLPKQKLQEESQRSPTVKKIPR